MALEGLGDAWVDVHARVDKNFDQDIITGVKKELKDADADINRVGQDFGKTLSKGIEKEVGTHGPDLGRSIEKAVEKEVVEVAPRWHYNVRGRDGRFIRRMVTDIEDEVGRAFASTSGTIFGKISQGVRDAIGSGFNLPGGSPLISLLIPAVGALVGLIVGAVQAANSLIAVLSTGPALVAAIGLQVGVLTLAFKGVGTAIQGAFAATNAQELREALKGLTPAAQQFVRQLLPLKGLFESLKNIAQQDFFKAFGTVVPQIQKALAPLLLGGFASLATALGGLFRQIALFFASPSFKDFVSKIIPATVDFLRSFGPGFTRFLAGFVQFATATIPFLVRLGHLLSDVLGQVGTFFMQAARDPALRKWFNDMFNTFTSLVSVVFALTGFIAQLLATLNNAGGQEVLNEIVKDLQLLTGFLASDAGQKALEGLIHTVIFALQVTTGLIVAFLFVFASLESFFEWLSGTAIPALGTFFVWLGTTVWHALDVAGQAIRDFVFSIGRGIAEGFQAVIDFFVGLWNSINNGRGRLLLAVAALPGQIRAALGDLGSLLFNAGRNVLQSFINGFRSLFGPLAAAGREAIHQVTQFLPGSPAEEGPLSGSGYSYYRGQNLIKDFTKGIESETPTLANTSSEAISNIVFGTNSIRVGFDGVIPTQQQAQTTGAGVATGIMNGLAARNVRLAVRTL